jgi:uncharacterized protein (TIGR02996 family)
MPRILSATPEMTALLLAAQAEGEDDDTSRLVLADYLDERSDPRGEMVRLSTAQARLHKGMPEWHDLRERLEAWQERHQPDWLGCTPHLNLSLHRGLVGMRITTGMAVSPMLSRKLRSAITDGWADEFAVEMIDDAWLEQAHRMGRLGHVSTLRLRNPRLSRQGAARLVELEPRLQGLDLGGGIGDELLDVLTTLSELRSLELERQQNMPEAVLERVLRMRRVEQVRLRVSEINPSLCLRLAKLPELRCLWLETRSESARGLQELAGAPHLQRLTLDLLKNTEAGAPLRDLARLRGLRHLGLSAWWPGNGFRLECLGELPDLRNLELRTCAPVTDHHLLKLAGMAHLECLRLAYCPCVTDDGIGVVRRLPALGSLTIGLTGITGAFLAGLEGLPRLTHLALGRHNLTAAGAFDALCRLTQMRELDLAGVGPLPDANIERLHQALPRCRIIR